MPKSTTSSPEKAQITIYLHQRKLNNDLPEEPQLRSYYKNLVQKDLGITTTDYHIGNILDGLEIPWTLREYFQPKPESDVSKLFNEFMSNQRAEILNMEARITCLHNVIDSFLQGTQIDSLKEKLNKCPKSVIRTEHEVPKRV
jgi:hypothetical protein